MSAAPISCFHGSTVITRNPVTSWQWKFCRYPYTWGSAYKLHNYERYITSPAIGYVLMHGSHHIQKAVSMLTRRRCWITCSLAGEWLVWNKPTDMPCRPRWQPSDPLVNEIFSPSSFAQGVLWSDYKPLLLIWSSWICRHVDDECCAVHIRMYIIRGWPGFLKNSIHYTRCQLSGRHVHSRDMSTAMHCSTT